MERTPEAAEGEGGPPKQAESGHPNGSSGIVIETLHHQEEPPVGWPRRLCPTDGQQTMWASRTTGSRRMRGRAINPLYASRQHSAAAGVMDGGIAFWLLSSPGPPNYCVRAVSVAFLRRTKSRRQPSSLFASSAARGASNRRAQGCSTVEKIPGDITSGTWQ